MRQKVRDQTSGRYICLGFLFQIRTTSELVKTVCVLKVLTLCHAQTRLDKDFEKGQLRIDFDSLVL